MSTERNPFPTSSSASSSPSSDMTADDLSGGPGSMEPSTPSGTAPAANGSRGSDLLHRVVNTAHQTIDRLADKAAPHVSKLEGGVGGAGDMLSQRADQVRDMSDEWMESCRTSVREHPLAAVGIALVAGMLLARLASHR